MDFWMTHTMLWKTFNNLLCVMLRKTKIRSTIFKPIQKAPINPMVDYLHGLMHFLHIRPSL